MSAAQILHKAIASIIGEGTFPHVKRVKYHQFDEDYFYSYIGVTHDGTITDIVDAFDVNAGWFRYPRNSSVAMALSFAYSECTSDGYAMYTKLVAALYGAPDIIVDDDGVWLVDDGTGATLHDVIEGARVPAGSVRLV